MHAAEFKNSGVTHYAIEAPHDSTFDRLNEGAQADLSTVRLVPESIEDSGYENAVCAMSTQGVKIVGVDFDPYTKATSEEREAILTENVRKILREDPNAKVVVLAGAYHANKKKSEATPPSMTSRLIEEGVDVITLRYVGGVVDTPKLFLNAAKQASMDRTEFMMDLRPYDNQAHVIFGAGNIDFVVHLTEDAVVQQSLGRSALRSPKIPRQ